MLFGKPIQQEIAERAYVRLVSAVPYNASRAASAASWKHEPFTDGVPLAYQAMFDDEQFARLKTGFVPQEIKTSGSPITRNPTCSFTAAGQAKVFTGSL